MGRIIEALWDCSSCGRRGIGGLTKRCPGCGAPQDENVKFYLPTDKKALDEETASQYGKGADWVCSYCGADNRYNAEYCVNCGAPRNEKKGDLGSIKKPEIPDTCNSEAKERPKRKSLLPVFAAILAILVLFGWFMGRPKNLQANITDLQWTRVIALEEKGIHDESGWNVPDGADVYDRRQEISGYNSVFDHYENVEVQHSRQVITGYNTSTSYVNNNDGTYSEVTHETPVYGTEYYYTTESQPVYRQEPVYSTRYYYHIERWSSINPVITEGSNKSTPYWGDVNLKDNQRESYRSESYSIYLQTDKDKSYSAVSGKELWNSINIGDKVDAVIQGGQITQINGISVN